jgi:hypothetical protein
VLNGISHINIYYVDSNDFFDFVENWELVFDTLLINDLNLLSHESWDLIEVSAHNLHPLPIASWWKCVLHHHVSRTKVHIHLSIAKFEIDSCWNRLKTWWSFTLIPSSCVNTSMLTPLFDMRKICCLKLYVPGRWKWKWW